MNKMTRTSMQTTHHLDTFCRLHRHGYKWK